ncbi:MAG: hypothetical protein JO311_02025 [Candidatus Eremiobacteraeota bacterium]|nr:hypothetical protein [Candidatus Eremiobacteraeota bacterium]
MRIAFTANGPGEVAGWLRPLLRALYRRAPDLESYVFLVPDDYASGLEANFLRDAFPQARVYEPKSYVKFALGSNAGVPDRVDLVQYVGGDLVHCARLHARLRGRAATYKFSRRAYRRLFSRAFAVDARNVAELAGWGIPVERILEVGNLAIDGAVFESGAPAESGAPIDGILFMPGSRAYEVENLVPFYLAVALRIRRERPEVRLAFAMSPFTTRAQIGRAIERGGHPRMFGRTGRFVTGGTGDFIEDRAGGARIPVLYNALSAARSARLALTIPGTKTIELAALGVPMVTMSPLNAPEVVTINGPLTYLDRVPFVGIPLKRAVAVSVARRFPFHTQPNMDAGTPLVREMRGTVTPARVASVALSCYDDAEWLRSVSVRLQGLYRNHAGAADRMASSLLSLAA